jgi:hypothetical protein
MKSLLELWHVLANELARIVGTNTTKDYNYVLSRVENEGISFLTITLPEYGKDFEKSLARGQVDADVFTAFRRGRHSRLPHFLSGFLSLVFDSNSGVILDDPEIEAIFAIRQLAGGFAKIEIPCSDERVFRAILGYLRTEKDVAEHDIMLKYAYGRNSLPFGLPPGPYKDLGNLCAMFSHTGSLLFGNIFSKLEQDIYELKLIPKHGPGATADRLSGNGKFDQYEWTARLESVFPYGEYALPSWRHFHRLEDVDILPPERERPVRVITVPKTLKTPRIIAIEPTCMQYTQQALSERLVEYIESDFVLKNLIGFTDQVPNQDLACEGSLNGSLATLDLSEASDRVSNVHVRALLGNHPLLGEAVQACRSTKAHVPEHGGRPEMVIDLHKFASMGSALTFPMEAMIFLTIIASAVQLVQGHRYQSRVALLRELDGVRVYGDDIIVPTTYAVPVMESLEALGFRVNSSKSFWTGLFRESCGKEFFAGQDVSITRVRREFPDTRADVQEIISLVELRNRFYEAGLWQTAKFLEDRLGKLFPLRLFPAIRPESPLLGRVSVLRRLGFQEGDRFDLQRHAPVVQGYTVVSRSPLSRVSGEGALLKWFLKRGSEPFEKDHLDRSGRPDAVYLKRRWASPF